MTPQLFEQIVEDEFPRALPPKYRELLSNVAFVIEDEPDDETRREQELGPDETLLGFYRGIPATARGDMYGVGFTMPDQIVLYQIPILEEAQFLSKDMPDTFEDMVRKVVRETIWHEVAHHFGYDEDQVREREERRGTF